MSAFDHAQPRLAWPTRRRADGESVGGAVAKFAITALLAVLLIGVGGVVAIRHTASHEALREAREFARVAGRGIVEPHVTPAVLRGDPKAVAALDRVVRRRLLGEGVVRVKIWSADGRIVYSDAPPLIGSRYRLGEDERAAIRTQGVYADASDLSRPENRFERRYGRMVEVYLGIHATDGTPLLFEDYERSTAISASARRRWLALAPALIGALLVLEVLLVPVAWSMARRLRDRQRERVELLRRAVESSELERRRVAADLHDGPLQRLAGLSFDLSAEAALVATRTGAEAQGSMTAAAGQARETLRELRALLVEIYPPTLRDAGLAAAVEDLASPLAADGVDVRIDVPDPLLVSDGVEALLFRAAQEALRNTRKHAAARHVSVEVDVDPRIARLVVADDGRGFDARSDAPEGHFGMRLMDDLARHNDGTLTVDAAPGEGTTVTLEVPLT